MTVLKPPDVKALVMGHLGQLGVPIVSTRPDSAPPARFVRVIGSGGPGRHGRILATVQVTVDSYAESTGKAFELARDVDALIHALPSTPGRVQRVPYSTTPADYPDPDMPPPRHQRYSATYQLTVICS